jgi:hypothetical protein
MLRTFVRRLSGAGAAAALGLATLGLVGTSAFAAPLSVQSNNSTVTVDPNSQSGLSSWVVDGTNQLNQQWFWYSVGSSAPQSIDTLNNTFSFNQDGVLTETYGGDGFTLTLNATLTGGAVNSGNSAMTQTVSVDNNTDSDLDFHLYEYSDFTLNNKTLNNNTLTLSGSPVSTADQTAPLGTTMNIGVNPSVDHSQIGTNGAIKLALNNGSTPVTLGDNGIGPIIGNTNFAFEWDPTIAVNGTFQESIVQSIQGGVVPLPSAAFSAVVLLAVLSGINLTRKAVKVIA